jgi:hypothetical protein
VGQGDSDNGMLDGLQDNNKGVPAITTTPDKLFLTGVSGSVPRFASLKTCAVEYVGFSIDSADW